MRAILSLLTAVLPIVLVFWGVVVIAVIRGLTKST